MVSEILVTILAIYLILLVKKEKFDSGVILFAIIVMAIGIFFGIVFDAFIFAPIGTS